MSFWNKVRRFFGGGGGGEGPPDEGGAGDLPGHDPALVRAVRAEVAVRCAAGKLFEPVDVADVVTQESGERTVAAIRAACAVVEAMAENGELAALGYTQTNGIHHPLGADPATYAPRYGKSSFPPPAARAPAPQVPRAPAAPRVPAGPPAPLPDPFAGSPEILGLGAAALRERALKIKPWQTAWIGRVDTIPPQNDERTAIIDRGLELRGLLTREQLEEIHRVGDAWLRVNEAARLAEAAARANVDAYLAELRAQKAALRAQKKQEAADRRAKRAAEIAKRRAEDIVFLGRGVSAGLADRRSQVEELERRGLPLLASPADVARALGLSVKRLRWLAFHAEAPTRTHYVTFEVPKRTGGMRLLAAPHEELKRAQRWILEAILEKLPVTEAAHGFVAGRSVVSNAAAHVARDVVVNCDLQSFFPSIGWRRVRGVFEAIGYSPAVATVLALLCTEAPRTTVVHEGRTHLVAVGERALPQGAPTSPALSNQIARKLDRRLRGLCKKLGWAYTRYADDLTFSAGVGHRDQIGHLLACVRHIAEDEGFRLNAKKCRVQRAARRQEVTGVVVNDRLGLPREELRRIRAILHRAGKEGLAAQNRENRPDFEAWLRGKIAYVAMVDRAKGEAFRAELDAITGAA